MVRILVDVAVAGGTEIHRVVSAARFHAEWSQAAARGLLLYDANWIRPRQRHEAGRIAEDPAAGTTGFWLRLQAHLRRQYLRAKWSRPELDKALDFMREGDTLVVTRFDRLGRNVREAILTIADLSDRGMNVRVLEPSLDTGQPTQKVVMTIMSALAEWERDLLIARTREGVAHAARAEGRVAGPKPKLSPEQLRLARQAVASGEPVASVARSLGVSRQTVYRALEKGGTAARGVARD